MLMLSVFRDGTLHGQAELTVQGLRIGRGSENDIVLEDAAKRVSRLHAELRLEADGAITLTDLQSANGTWIAGDRVENEPIEPGVPFTIGPYRLMLEELTDAGAADYPSDSLPVAAPIPQPPESVAQAPAPSGVKRKGDTTKTQGWKAAAGVMDLALKHRWADDHRRRRRGGSRRPGHLRHQQALTRRRWSTRSSRRRHHPRRRRRRCPSPRIRTLRI